MKKRVTISVLLALTLTLALCFASCDVLKKIADEVVDAERTVFTVTDPTPLKAEVLSVTLELLDGGRFNMTNKVEYSKESGFDEIELKGGWYAIQTNSGTYVYSGEDTIVLTLTGTNEKYVFENEEDRLAVKSKYDQLEGNYYEIVSARLSESGYTVPEEKLEDLSRIQYELKLVKRTGKAYITQEIREGKSQKYYYTADYLLLKTESDSRTVEFSYNDKGEPTGKTVTYAYDDEEGKHIVSVTEYNVVENSFHAFRYTVTEDGVVKTDDYYDDDTLYD